MSTVAKPVRSKSRGLAGPSHSLVTLVLPLVTLLVARSTLAMPEPVWLGEGIQSGAAYGFATATGGDVNGDGYGDLVIAAPWNDNAGADRGRVWVHYGSDAGLTAAAWQVDGEEANDHYGYSVACVGDVNGDGYDDVLVGAALADTGTQDADGAIYLYHGSASGLASSPAWWRDGPQTGALLGTYVAGGADFNGDGYDDFVAGAPGYDVGSSLSAGRIQIYYGGSGLPTYGGAIAGWYSAAWVGHTMTTLDFNADGYDDLVSTRLTTEGSWHGLFLGGAGGLSTSAVREHRIGDAVSGSAISTAGDVNGDGYEDLLYGWPGWLPESDNTGKVMVWYGSFSLAQEDWWEFEGSVAGERLGSSVGYAGDVNGDGYSDFLVHADGAGSSGEVGLFYGSANGPTDGPVWQDAGGSDSYFGWRLGPAGDVDGDGYSDFFLGSPYEDNPDGGEGRVAIYRGGSDSPGSLRRWQVSGGQPDGLFGTAVALGDFDGDGADDVVVGTGSWDGLFTDGGQVTVHYGGVDVSDRPDWTADGENGGDLFGDAVATALDVDGDGYEDLLIGSPGWGGGQGKAYLYRGGLTGLELTPGWTGTGNGTGDAFGASVACAGDVNADGFADVIVGAPGAAGSSETGGAAVYLGSGSGLLATAVWSIAGSQPGDRFGFSVASAGDANGDGFSDVIVGAPGMDDPEVDEGATFLYFGFGGGISPVAPWATDSDDPGAQHGFSVSGAGDVDGDGLSDVVVGAPYYGSTDAGRVDVYHGSTDASGFGLEKQWTGPQAGAWSGWSVASADLNQDGLSDIVIGAPGVDNGQVDEGQVWSYRAPFDDPSPWFANDGNVDYALHGTVVVTGDLSGDGFPDILAGAPGKLGEPSSEGWAYVWPGNGIWQGGSTGPSLGEGTQRLFRAFTTDGSRPVALLGGVDGDEIRLGGYVRSPLGRDDVRLEVEVKPLGVPFDGAGTMVTGFVDTGNPSPEFGSRAYASAVATGLELGAHRWRARLVGKRPYWKHSPWFSPSRNGWTETDFRRRSDVVAVEVVEGAIVNPLAALPSVFQRATTLRFDQPSDGHVVLRIFDARGREVDRLFDGMLGAGSREFVWAPADRGVALANGVYFASLEREDSRSGVKLLRVR